MRLICDLRMAKLRILEQCHEVMGDGDWVRDTSQIQRERDNPRADQHKLHFLKWLKWENEASKAIRAVRRLALESEPTLNTNKRR